MSQNTFINIEPLIIDNKLITYKEIINSVNDHNLFNKYINLLKKKCIVTDCELELNYRYYDNNIPYYIIRYKQDIYYTDKVSIEDFMLDKIDDPYTIECILNKYNITLNNDNIQMVKNNYQIYFNYIQEKQCDLAPKFFSLYKYFFNNYKYKYTNPISISSMIDNSVILINSYFHKINTSEACKLCGQYFISRFEHYKYIEYNKYECQ